MLKNPGSDSYIIYGEPKYQDQQQQTLQQAAQALSLAKEKAAKNKEGASEQPPPLEEVKPTDTKTTPAPAATETKKEGATEGDSKDVELVMAQVR